MCVFLWKCRRKYLHGKLLYMKTLNIEGIINHRTCKGVLSLRIDKEEESNLLFLWKEKQEHGQF